MKGSHFGAQTVRRGGVGPVRNLLGGKPHRPLFRVNRACRAEDGLQALASTSRSIPKEPAVKLPVVPAVHVAIAVEIEVPNVTGLAGRSIERRSKGVAVDSTDVVVTVAVAEHPED